MLFFFFFLSICRTTKRGAPVQCVRGQAVNIIAQKPNQNWSTITKLKCTSSKLSTSQQRGLEGRFHSGDCVMHWRIYARKYIMFTCDFSVVKLSWNASPDVLLLFTLGITPPLGRRMGLGVTLLLKSTQWEQWTDTHTHSGYGNPGCIVSGFHSSTCTEPAVEVPLTPTHSAAQPAFHCSLFQVSTSRLPKWDCGCGLDEYCFLYFAIMSRCSRWTAIISAKCVPSEAENLKTTKWSSKIVLKANGYVSSVSLLHT